MIKINRRSILGSILLSIFTLGIYGINWQYQLVKNTRALMGKKGCGIGELMLYLFVPFYAVYWWFTRGKFIKHQTTLESKQRKTDGLMYLLFAVFGLVIVNMAVMQKKCNAMSYESASEQHNKWGFVVWMEKIQHALDISAPIKNPQSKNKGKLTDLQYLKLNKFAAFFYNVTRFIRGIPQMIVSGFIKIINVIKDGVFALASELLDIVITFFRGNWVVKSSFLIFGFGNLFYGQSMRGLLFLAFEVIFIAYMFLPQGGLFWINKLNLLQTGATVGTVQGGEIYNEVLDQFVRVDGDDSTRVLLYGLLSVLFIVAFVWTWRMQIKQCRICMNITAQGKQVRSARNDLRSLVDNDFHKTLLALPLGGIMFFTVLPIIYMVLIAFTNYSAEADGYSKLFQWVGLSNFAELLDFGKGGMGLAFRETLSWTLMWSFFATFSNYFLGMFVAIMINKKGIRIKKFWRTVLVMTIAIPQFVSLLYVGRMFDSDGFMGKGLTTMLSWIPEGFMEGAVGSWLTNLCPWLPDLIAGKGGLWDNATTARAMIIIINIWVGIPYIMLMATGILMNIPQDLYESSRIDGANTFQQYTKITLPYMLFVTGPYLLTSFVGNLNNFNVIYLLSSSGGIGTNLALGNAGGVSVGNADLLITWLYKMTLENATSKYYAASMIGILVFLVVAILSLVVYNVIPSTTNEEDFS